MEDMVMEVIIQLEVSKVHLKPWQKLSRLSLTMGMIMEVAFEREVDSLQEVLLTMVVLLAPTVVLLHPQVAAADTHLVEVVDFLHGVIEKPQKTH